MAQFSRLNSLRKFQSSYCHLTGSNLYTVIINEGRMEAAVKRSEFKGEWKRAAGKPRSSYVSKVDRTGMVEKGYRRFVKGAQA